VLSNTADMAMTSIIKGGLYVSLRNPIHNASFRILGLTCVKYGEPAESLALPAMGLLGTGHNQFPAMKFTVHFELHLTMSVFYTSILNGSSVLLTVHISHFV